MQVTTTLGTKPNTEELDVILFLFDYDAVSFDIKYRQSTTTTSMDISSIPDDQAIEAYLSDQMVDSIEKSVFEHSVEESWHDFSTEQLELHCEVEARKEIVKK